MKTYRKTLYLGLIVLSSLTLVACENNHNAVSKSASSSTSKKAVKKSLKINGKKRGYTDFYLTANKNRQATISGTVTGIKKINIQENFGEDNEYTVSANSKGNFSKMFTLPRNKAETSYFVSYPTKNDYEDNGIVEVHIRSINYEAEQTSIDKKAAASYAQSSKIKKQTAAKKFENKLNSLNKGTAESVTYNSKTNTVTWIGFDDWKSWSKSELQKPMDLLQAMTLRQEVNYGISSVHIIVQFEDGTVIAKNSDTNEDLQIIK